MVFDTRMAGSHALPPPASSRFVVRDRGNCSPRYLRCTLNHVPNTPELLNNCAMPLALVVSPLALPDPGDEPIQVRTGGLTAEWEMRVGTGRRTGQQTGTPCGGAHQRLNRHS